MKRSTANFSARKLSQAVVAKRNSAVLVSVSKQRPGEAYLERYTFTQSVTDVTGIIEQVVGKVNSTIKHIEEKKFFQGMQEYINEISKTIENSN
jgi:hypothetical protein